MSRKLEFPTHEEITIGWLPSSGPFQIPPASALIFTKVSVLLILTLVRLIKDAVLLVMVVDSCLLGGPETVMTLFVMEPQAAMGVYVGVGVGVEYLSQ